MIERYSLPKMANLWNDQTKFNHFLEVEIASSKAFMHQGIVPKDDFEKILKNASFNLFEIKELEMVTKHDVIAFTRSVSNSLGKERKWIHYGLTSTDIVDTANALTIKKANQILLEDLKNLRECLKEKAIKYISTPCIGRTHGMHAEITCFGLKWALWYDELNRNIERFNLARKNIEVGKISGAVGNYLTTSIEIEKEVCQNLGIAQALISTQVLSRDRHAEYIMSLSLIASLLEKIATELDIYQERKLEKFKSHLVKTKKVLVQCHIKRIQLLVKTFVVRARIMRSYVNVALENNILWHERDISHSSSERIMLADSTILLDYMLNRYTKTLNDLVVNEEKMLENIYITNGVIFSGNLLNKMVKKGISRELAYDQIQPITFMALQNNTSFKDLVLESSINTILTIDEIEECFTMEQYLCNVKNIYQNVGIYEEEKYE